jgi:hypothetical protein
MGSLNLKTLNGFIEKTWSGNTVITEMKHFPKFEYVDDKFVQKEAYEIKYNGDKPSLELSLNVEKYLNVELIWEEDIIPLIPYEK